MNLSILKYEYRKYIKSNKYIVPLIVLFSYLAAAYSVGPLSVLSSYSLSAMWIFVIMAWMGFSYNDVKEIVIEQVIYLKINNKGELWFNKIILMFLISSILSLFAIIYPLISNALNHFVLFERPVYLNDIFLSYIIHFIFACVGSVIGLLFNDRIFKNRKQATVLLILFVLLTIVRGAIEQDNPVLKSIMWILPPIYSFTDLFGKMEYVIYRELIFPLAGLLVYLVIECLIYVKTMKYRLFH